MDYRFKLTLLYAAAAMGTASCASYSTEKGPALAATDNAVISVAIPRSTSIRLREQADLDSDGDIDVLLVLERTGNALAKNEPMALLILLRNERGTLDIAATSPRVILCRTCGGAMNDPLQGITPLQGGFVLRFEGGSRELWHREYRFTYSPKARTWLLDAISDKVLDRLDGDAEQSNSEPAALRPVSIEKFDSQEFQEDTISDL